jgi:hypothetical protein
LDTSEVTAKCDEVHCEYQTLGHFHSCEYDEGWSMCGKHTLQPSYQDNVSFLSVKADQTGMSAITKTYNVSAFPTVILFGVEVDHIAAPAGGGRKVSKMVECIDY